MEKLIKIYCPFGLWTLAYHKCYCFASTCYGWVLFEGERNDQIIVLDVHFNLLLAASNFLERMKNSRWHEFFTSCDGISMNKLQHGCCYGRCVIREKLLQSCATLDCYFNPLCSRGKSRSGWNIQQLNFHWRGKLCSVRGMTDSFSPLNLIAEYSLNKLWVGKSRWEYVKANCLSSSCLLAFRCALQLSLTSFRDSREKCKPKKREK